MKSKYGVINMETCNACGSSLLEGEEKLIRNIDTNEKTAICDVCYEKLPYNKQWKECKNAKADTGKAKVKVKTKVVFELDEVTALWLKSLLQNPLYDDESYEEGFYRKTIFSALINVDVQPLLDSSKTWDDVPY